MGEEMSKKVYIISIIIFIIDGLSKSIVSTYLKLNQSIEIIKDFFYLRYINNTGASWGILENNRILLIIISLIALVILIRYMNSFKKTKLNIKLPIAPRGSEEKLKALKSEIGDILKEIKELSIYEDEEEIKSSIKDTYKTIKIIIELILEFTERTNKYKQDNNSYEFNDIAIMAINILKENDIFSIRKIGKFKYVGIIKTTKNNNYIVKVLKYI